jgi:hypothetical protein
MSATLIDKTELSTHTDTTLGAYLFPLIGQPFLFARLGYAEELTLHFGVALEAKHKKLREAGVRYGSYILLVRGSAWIVDAGNQTAVDQLAKTMLQGTPGAGKPLGKEEIAKELIRPGLRVVAVTPFIIPEPESFALRLDLADRSTVVVIPTVDESEIELADWELATPRGTISVGPGLKAAWHGVA